MTKKHFIAVATIMQKARLNQHNSSIIVIEQIENDLAEYFGQNNNLFDTTRFLMACRGIKRESIKIDPEAKHVRMEGRG